MVQMINVSEVDPILNQNGVVGKRIYDQHDAQVVHIAFEPNASLPKHETPVDVFFYILEGDAEIAIGAEQTVAKKDSIIYSPKKTAHAIRNIGPGVLRILVGKTPRP